jgi:hypothetical protein
MKPLWNSSAQRPEQKEAKWHIMMGRAAGGVRTTAAGSFTRALPATRAGARARAFVLMAVAVNAEGCYHPFIVDTNGFDQHEPGTPGDQRIQILHSVFFPPKKRAASEAAL